MRRGGDETPGWTGEADGPKRPSDDDELPTWGRRQMPVVTAGSPALFEPTLSAQPLARLRVLPAMAHSIDAAGRLIDVSDLWLSTLGHRREEVVGRRIVEFLTPESRAHAERVVLPAFFRNGFCRNIEYQMVRADGGVIDVLLSATLIGESAAVGPRSLAILTDITAQRAAERRLAESEARFRLLAESSTDMIVMLDRNLLRVYVSPASLELFGEPPEELIGTPFGRAAHSEDSMRLEQGMQALLSGELDIHAIVCRRRHRDGRWIWVEGRFRALKDPETGAVNGVIGSIRDISAHKAAEDKLADAYGRLEVIAGEDGLTGLFNRRSFDDALARLWLTARERATPLSLILVDVDGFKSYNDHYGHLGGDDCLRLVAKAIKLSLYRGGDCAARYGGEEFAILSPETDEAGAAVIGERIRQAVRMLNIEHLGSANRTLTVSVGVAAVTATDSDASAEALIRRADRALYAAKAAGRDRVRRGSECEGNSFAGRRLARASQVKALARP
jgi:diguanylate cyclase (GGDEF)-like protein/PAS domain S-box-containing protein